MSEKSEAQKAMNKATTIAAAATKEIRNRWKMERSESESCEKNKRLYMNNNNKKETPLGGLKRGGDLGPFPLFQSFNNISLRSCWKSRRLDPDGKCSTFIPFWITTPPSTSLFSWR